MSQKDNVYNERLIPKGLPGGFFIYNAEGDEEIIYADDNVIALFGCETMEEFRAHVNNSFTGMVHPDDLNKIHNNIKAQTFNSEIRHDYVRYRILTKSGDVRYIEDFGHLLHGDDGHKYFYVYIVDVDKDEYYNRNRNSYAETQVFSMHQYNDKLTGLLSRGEFYEQVQSILDDPDDLKDNNYTFIHFDIVHFSMFNENFGYERGDDLLCKIATTLKNEFSESIISRFSGDHFEVFTAAEKPIMNVIRVHTAVLHILAGLRVELKAGLYSLDNTCSKVGTGVDRARVACNTIKRHHEKVYNIYDPELSKKMKAQQYVLDFVDSAAENGDIRVFYQPIIRVKTGKICGYEALARWIDSDIGFLSPNDFIPTLEEYHLIHLVDLAIIRNVCKDLRTLIDKDESVVPVSINISRLSFEFDNMYEMVEMYRKQYNIERNMIDIEITESALNEESDVLRTAMKRFKKAGYRVWIDDFGSGYSSLNTLLDYDFDVLKLDLEFLRTYDRTKSAAKLIRHIIEGAREVGVIPLQEGVESDEHFELLKEIGCDKAQGFFFAKPMALEESRKYTRKKGLLWE